MPAKFYRLGLLICLLLLLVGLGVQIYGSALSVTNYPLATDWSESWRIFGAATIFSRLIFDQKMPLPWLDPARAMLESLVFLIPGSEIWMIRLWKALLLFGTTFFAAVIIHQAARRNQRSGIYLGKILTSLIICWSVLYLLQPPFNYHVLLGTLVVLAFFDTSKPIRMMILIILASAWEGFGRVNWFIMPALVASTLYFFEVPYTGIKFHKYFQKPFLWCLVGGITSTLVYLLLIRENGYVSTIFTPSMEYHYFSFKLWPNPGYDLGLIPGITLFSFPIGLLILLGAWKLRNRVHWLRWLSLAAILLLLFVGSTIVSLRSGGGYDLHNYDTFILIFFLVGMFIGLQSVRAEDGLPVSGKQWLEHPLVLVLLLLVPLYFSIRGFPKPVHLDEQLAYSAIDEINTVIQDPSRQDGQVLFLDQRQLLVYRQVDVQEVFFPYDRLYLMEMAMANYKPYLDEFAEDVQQHEFSYIISDPLNIWPQDGGIPWGYENNVYIEYVSLPILAEYEPVYMNKDLGIAIYAPIMDQDE